MNCVRCGRPEAPALTRRPVRGPLGIEIQEEICADCWAEWQKVEVMVMNELRLNFMDPDSQKVLKQHMREVLFHGGTGASGAPGAIPIG